MRLRSKSSGVPSAPAIGAMGWKSSAVPSATFAAMGWKTKPRGFTLIELVIVISMVLVLMAIALPMYNRSITNAKEARFKNNLSVLNEMIQRYSEDKRQAPQQLQDLVDAGYLKSIPDDITGSNTTWVTEQEQDPEKAWNPDQMGIASVHSGSEEQGSDSRPYSQW